MRIDGVGQHFGRQQAGRRIDRIAHALGAECRIVAVARCPVVHPEEFALLERHQPDQRTFGLGEVDFDHHVGAVGPQLPHQPGDVEGDQVVVPVDPLFTGVFAGTVAESGLRAVEGVDRIPFEETDAFVCKAFQVVEDAVVESADEVAGRKVPLRGVGFAPAVADDPFGMPAGAVQCGVDPHEREPDAGYDAVAAERIHKGLQTPGQPFGMGPPVAHGLLPAVVEDENVDAHFGGQRDFVGDALLGERLPHVG